jgi:nitrogen fixation protein NifX
MGLQRHLRILSGRTEAPAMLPTVKVAFASSDRKHVDQHFGSACAFVIYAVNPDQAVLLEVAQFENRLQDGHEDKLAAKLELLEGCAAVYCQAVGGSAIRQLLQRGIQPLRLEEGATIEHLLDGLQQEFRTGGPDWLAKARQRRVDTLDRFVAMEAEGWQE